MTDLRQQIAQKEDELARLKDRIKKQDADRKSVV